MSSLSLRPNNLWLLIGLALLSTVLARLPIVHLLVYPFALFNTYVHELSHGVAAFLTGGSLRHFVVRADGSGVATSAGGIRWIVTSAGYIGSALVGGGLIVLATRTAAPQKVMLGLGIGLALLCVLFVRNIFGIVAGIAIAGGLMAAALLLAPRWNAGLLLFLAVQTALNALDSLWGLLRISTVHRQELSDATIMQRSTGIPAVVWALLWSVLAVLILWQAIRWAYNG